MPSLLLPECTRYVEPPTTNEDLDFVNLSIIDLAKARNRASRDEVVAQLRDALRTQGFIYAINHGYTKSQRDRMFDIANVSFSDVSAEEKQIYVANIEKVGYYQGYKPRQYWKVGTDTDVRDQIEQYAINKNVHRRPHPQSLRPFLPEIDDFVKHNHFNIVHPLLRLIALSLELPEDTLVNKHRFEGIGESCFRTLKYFRRSPEDEEKSNGVWLKGHTDIGSLSVLWSQPVTALQILSAEGKWQWVRHIDNAVVVNTGDMLNFLTGGFIKPTIHRVVQPPEDQRAYDRLGLFYFSMPEDAVVLKPLSGSPVLEKAGAQSEFQEGEAPTVEAWRISRTITYGRTQLKKADGNIETEIVQGAVVKHYN
ncbi:Clavaminate synthase-like protein [Coniophora puteana RWD-64-598 SS2]|uniref:Clavaminate synthase-like protein n=1 Tax=Coniophora puteana (strain RWD-64-598) TaxID=741705 RepID=A0A5M3M9M2_CONPW|nr:Clavaminate synthase-like protein [Coniophora puteana RWD-64-598 SS2]EIW75982.1 Clavaminate synthase-like protein [Coniophora puteana RWD-64-598 SS2]